jgi:iron complex outermembrane receptor protein
LQANVIRAESIAVACAVLAAAPALATAQKAGQTVAVKPPIVLSPVVVTATRSVRPAFDVPASIDAIALDRIDADQPHINPSEALRAVPGVLARDRQNYAQDEQVSIRGFGARSTFGVRGVRLYVDGIPATMPDGQGELSAFSLGSADRIEVLRGPFSALYGNSSGGVIQIFTADGTDPPQWRITAGIGSYGANRLELGARGIADGVGYTLDASRFRSDGFRRHSRAERDNGNAKLTFPLANGGELTVLANGVAMPLAQDPKGLTRAQFRADPRQAAPSALVYDTRKSVHQTQGGMIYRQPLGHGQTVRVLAYDGRRNILQFLSVPVAAQADPLSSGGVIDLGSTYAGADARWTWDGELASRPLQVTAGMAWDRQDQHRHGYENFVGAALGVRGALRRDERDDVRDFDQYAQLTWRFAPHWSLSAGARHSTVRFSVADHYITAGNPDDSGRKVYAATNPVAGVMFRATAHWHLYASWGHGFETPTFSELAYRTDGGSGLNFGLRAARSDNVEVGSKLRWDNGSTLDIALFQAGTRDELAVASSDGGRTTYRNAGRARRRGAELDLHLALAPRWRLDVAYTFLDARFARTRLPGVPRSALNAALDWGGARGWHAGVDLSAIGAVSIDDADSQYAPGYAVAGAHVGYVLDTAHAEIAPFLRIDNVLDRRYIGSVIVNQANGGAFEPGPGRSVFLGCNVRFER